MHDEFKAFGKNCVFHFVYILLGCKTTAGNKREDFLIVQRAKTVVG